MIRRALLLSGILTLGGCAHVGLMPTSEHRHFASAAFEYALLANNAYGEDGSWIQLPRDVSLEVECGNDELGLAYSIFRKEQGARDEYIFAFRGTEDGAEGDKDWKHGNIGRQQQRKSEAIVDAFATAHKDHNIVLIGHSLGGALAVHNSMRVNDQAVFIFNSSPRFYAPPHYDPKLDSSDRLSIVERGEILKAARILFKEALQTYMPFDCFGKGGPRYQHSILRLAVCLTRIAASEPGTAAAVRARQYLDKNPWAVEATVHPLSPLTRPSPGASARHDCHTTRFNPPT